MIIECVLNGEKTKDVIKVHSVIEDNKNIVNFFRDVFGDLTGRLSTIVITLKSRRPLSHTTGRERHSKKQHWVTNLT